MKPTFSLCLLLVGLHTVALCHQHPRYRNKQDNSKGTHYPGHSSQWEEASPLKNKTFVKLVLSNAEFAFSFYKLVASEATDKNIFFSPISISASFAMLALGAKAVTLTQILEGLAFNLKKTQEQEIHEGFCQLLHMLNRSDSEFQLSLGNALFIEETLKPLQKFLYDVKSFYESEVFSTDFNNSVGAESEINSYIDEKTNGKIVKIVENLDPLTAMVLVNYVFFKVDMMYRKGYYRNYFDEELSCWLVQIPYSGDVAALFVLPDEGKMKQVEDALVKKTITKWEKSLHDRKIHLHIPKFSISGTYDVKNIVKQMGMVDLFTEQADLSGITEEPGLMVSKALSGISSSLLSTSFTGKQPTTQESSKNIFFSPVSISAALALLALGSRGTSQAQVLEGLAFNLPSIQKEEIHDGFRQLLLLLNCPGSQVQLSVGNTLFMDKHLKPMKMFLKDIKKLYRGKAISSNFQNATEAKKRDQ
ncbi:hypothetical protein DUI87_25002 [Hirundo rustica rustica]|uniref:Serpin domain-containing protein n=1 Tax=Hirundo rustica rustica TaxID=333673 RepID=A0A3M0JIE6_HIRRU|nr:hypothetical protein DUI87_25002 [Hirundo rustica rustica]